MSSTATTKAATSAPRNDTAVDAAVHQLYEDFPYPAATHQPDAPSPLQPFIDGQRAPIWNVRDSFSMYFPEKPPTAELDILLAGCGTIVAPRLAAIMPHARIVAIDISQASIDASAALAKRHSLTNIEFHQLPLEDVADLGRTFDFVESHGVLHHLADPAAGLRALGSVTRPDGALGLMVYGTHGRAGLYMLQQACRELGLSANTGDAERIQALLTTLSPLHPFNVVHADPRVPISLEEVSDMMLHPRDVSYDVQGVRALVEASGLKFQRWMGQAQYAPEVSPMLAAGLGPKSAALDPWQRASVMELYYGTITKHEFVVRPSDCRTPTEIFGLDEAPAADARILDAYPRLSPYLGLEAHGEAGQEAITLTNKGHQVAFQIGGPKAVLTPVLAEFDGRQTARELLTKECKGTPSPVQATERAELLQQLYAADVIDLSTTHKTQL